MIDQALDFLRIQLDNYLRMKLDPQTVIWDNNAFAHNGLVRPLFRDALAVKRK